jgi:hypothetical protein
MCRTASGAANGENLLEREFFGPYDRIIQQRAGEGQFSFGQTD